MLIKPIKIPKYHWKPDPVDTRDYKYLVTNSPQSNRVDLRQYCTAIENQGNLGSCTGQAIAGAIELLHKKKNINLDVSRLFIYYYERLIEGTVNYDSGAYIRDGIKAAYTYGAPLESLWPYVINRFTVKPVKEALADGLKRKVTLYQRVKDFAGCLDAITSGYPVIIGFNVYESFESNVVSTTGMMPFPDVNNEELLGGHCVLLVGYDRVQNYFIARNSWGTNWGDKGYFYMPFRVIQDPRLSGDFWIIKNLSSLPTK